ncbi:MAG: GAF domain-containing sensor histidine kinase [Chthonomonadaceae bacterium]|nr:GAF domain-containing sensor histidine kinase [Chthonomonadaceae bacterium]
MDTNEGLIRAVHLATRKLASTGDFDTLLKDVLAICVEAVGAEGGTIYTHDPAAKRLIFQHVLPAEVTERLPDRSIPDDFGIAGTAFQTRKIQISEFQQNAESARSSIEEATGVVVRTMITAPLMMEEEEPIGVVQLLNKRQGCFNENDAAVLDTVAAVSTLAYLNSQLLEESARASTLLGMGKVSHDIGNLAASLFSNLSFSELVMPGLRKEIGPEPSDTVSMYVDSLEDTFRELRESVDRIVGYSRLISDLSAGRSLRPNLAVAPMAATIQSSAAYLETDGRRNHVALRYEIDENAPPTLHDELYVFRIVQNLVGNAIKAVRETVPSDWQEKLASEHEAMFGEVLVRYRFDGSHHIVEVTDSGPGMTPEIAARILAGNAKSQWDKGSGSGWGTKIVLELAATHDAKVSIDSEPGTGTTFRVAFPHRPEAK